jgi:putative flippase GtrA
MIVPAMSTNKVMTMIMRERNEWGKVFRFLLVGVCNTLLSAICIVFMMEILKLDYRIANATGYAAGLVLSFILNRLWTFAYPGPWIASLVRWLVVALVAFGLNFAVIVALHQFAHANKYTAQIGGVLVYTMCSFLGARFFAFRPLQLRNNKQ